MTDTGKVLLAAGAVAVLVLLVGSGASASDGGGGSSNGKLPKEKKPTVKIDADDEAPDGGGSPVIEVDSPRIVTPEEYDRARAVDVPPMPNPAPGQGEEILASRDPSGAGRWQVENEDGTPVKADPALARQKAQSIADHVRTKKNAYDRPRLAVWQALAGLSGVDGLYGPATQSALQKMGAKNVPKPLFKGAA